LVALLLTAGCDRSGLNLAPAEGVVTLDGKPVAEAGVMFAPVDSTLGPPAMGVTDENGAFSMKTVNEDGALIGEHHVSVSKSEESVQPVPGSRALKYVVKRHVPERYESLETSGLKVTVPEDGGRFDLKLSSD
jgi:hypothetical protein